MTFAKSRERQEDHKGLEIVADNFTLTDGTQVSSAAKSAAITALSATAASTLPTDFASTKVEIDKVITALNAVKTALQT